MTAKTRKNRASLNFLMRVIGLAATVAFVAAYYLEWHSAVRVVSIITVLVSLATMFFTRKSDEYTLGLWSSGANAAFGIVILLMLFGPFFEGVYDGFMQAHDDIEREMDISGDLAGFGALLAFYLTFNIKRLTGAL